MILCSSHTLGKINKNQGEFKKIKVMLTTIAWCHNMAQTLSWYKLKGRICIIIWLTQNKEVVVMTETN